MIEIGLSSRLDPVIARFAREMVGGVLDACDPRKRVRDGMDLSAFGARTHVLAFGKASAGMASDCAALLGDRFVGGVVLAPDAWIPDDSESDGFSWYGGDHPLPTKRNVYATTQLVQYARSIPAGDDCIVCISGGGSAHLCSPNERVTLDEIVGLTDQLNASGVGIHELNSARQSLESLKGGGLAAQLAHVHCCHAVVLSDVLDDDLRIIASGPMLNPDYPVEHTIIGNHHTRLKAASELLLSRYAAANTSSESGVHGDSSACGRRLAEQYSNDPIRGVHISAGETTVNTDGATGSGGPCLEMVLSAALELGERLQGREEWIVLGIATDGIDGPSGACGAIITNKMLHSGLIPDCRRALAEHDSYGFLESTGSAIHTGPTGTNLNDLCILVPASILGI